MEVPMPIFCALIARHRALKFKFAHEQPEFRHISVRPITKWVICTTGFPQTEQLQYSSLPDGVSHDSNTIDSVGTIYMFAAILHPIAKAVFALVTSD